MWSMTVIAVEVFFSINALWKNKIAVLGRLSTLKRIVVSIDNDFDLLKIISVAVREMSEGELLN
jgi:octaprenyl-diphosphate synthase